MSEQVPKRKMGRPPGKGDDAPIKFKLPKGHYTYLRHLVVDKRRLGSSVHEAARFIVIRELDEMLKADYHKKEFG